MPTIIRFILIELCCCFILFPIHAQSSWYKQAIQAHEKGNYSQSTRLTKKALKEISGIDRSNAFYLLAQNKMQDAFRLDNKQIISYLDSVIHYNPKHIDAHYHLGSFHIYNNPSLGIKHLQQALIVDSSALNVLYVLSTYYMSINDYTNVLTYADLGIKQSTQYPLSNFYKVNFYFQRAEALYYTDEPETAIVALDSVIIGDSIDLVYTDQAQYTRGLCYSNLEQYDNAFNDLNSIALRLKAQALKKDEFLTYHLALACQFKTPPDLEQALYYINLSTNATRKNPNSTIEDLDFCYATRGAILLELKQFSKALDDFLLLQEDENKSYWLGLNYLKLGNYQKALYYLLNYLEYIPDDVEALTATAKCYYHLKQKTKACQYIHEVLAYYNEDLLEDADALQKLTLLQQDYCK